MDNLDFLAAMKEGKGWLVILSLLVVAVVVFIRTVESKRRKHKAHISGENSASSNSEEVEELSESDLGFVEDGEDRRNGNLRNDAIQKISSNEFEYQALVNTKREIQKLVSSEAYARLLKKKGADLD